MGGDKQVFLLMEVDANGAEKVVGAYASAGVAGMWQAQWLASMTKKLVSPDEEGKAQEIRSLLWDGHVERAEEIFLTLVRRQGERAWVVAWPMVSDPPQIGVVRRGF